VGSGAQQSVIRFHISSSKPRVFDKLVFGRGGRSPAKTRRTTETTSGISGNGTWFVKTFRHYRFRPNIVHLSDELRTSMHTHAKAYTSVDATFRKSVLGSSSSGDCHLTVPSNARLDVEFFLKSFLSSITKASPKSARQARPFG
jgi:hypothetical protein